MFKYFSFFALLICVSSISCNAFAELPATINIISVSESSTKTEYVKKLKPQLNAEFNEINLIKTPAPIHQKGVYLIIGRDALTKFIDLKFNAPSIAVFIKNSSFHHTIISAEHSYYAQGEQLNTTHIGAIFSDPLLSKQINIVKQIIGEEQSFGVILSPITLFLKPLINQYATQNNIKVKFIEYQKEDSINKALNSLNKQKAILAIPDRIVWNSTTLKNIIISTYKNEQPVIGFSRTLVKAGAVATLYSNLDDIVKETFDRINQLYTKKKSINKKALITNSPKYYSLKTNRDVLLSLNLREPKL